MNYSEFLENKKIKVSDSGFFYSKDLMCKIAFEWQKDIVHWAIRKGKAALFEECGLGKTLQQLMWSDAISKHSKGSVMIFAPLAVTQQTKKEGDKFGFEVNICRDQKDVIPGINITNYDIADRFDFSSFSGVVLDESSILKSFTSKTKQLFVDKCKNISYRLCCTATPSPNDFVELGNHSEFLGVMTRTEMLATFFVHDGKDTAKWRLKGHAEDKFFEWVASWACCITSPEDLGYDGRYYHLPELEIHDHVVKSDDLIDDQGQVMLLPKISQSLSERRTARRNSISDRVDVAAEIANRSNDQVLVWCDLNDESKMLAESIKKSVEVRGDNTADFKVSAMQDFSSGAIRCLISKPKIAGWGMNWQNCNEMIFVGLSDSFEAYYQAIRRCWRFGQKNKVVVHIIISDAEGAVKQNIKRKQADAEKMKHELIKHTRSILESEIRGTVRETEDYMAYLEMKVPNWLKVA